MKPALCLIWCSWTGICRRSAAGEILTAIRQIPGYSGIPVILFTGADPDDYRKEALELGATHFLRKATAIGELQQKLEYLFSQQWKQ